MNRIYAALAALSMLASVPAFAKSHTHVAKAPVADKAEAKPADGAKADTAKTDEAKPADTATAKPKKSTKKTTKKTEEKKEEAAPPATK